MIEKHRKIERQKATFILSKCIHGFTIKYVNLIQLFLCEKGFLRHVPKKVKLYYMSQKTNEIRFQNRRQ